MIPLAWALVMVMYGFDAQNKPWSGYVTWDMSRKECADIVKLVPPNADLGDGWHAKYGCENVKRHYP